MATTYELIASNTLSVATGTVTFSAIPQTFTDLLLKTSTRASDTGQYLSPTFRFNGDSASNYSWIFLYGYSTTIGAGSGQASTETYGRNQYAATASNATANAFGNGEIYIPSYRVSANKPVLSLGVAATNAGSSFLAQAANLWRNTAAITSIEIKPTHGAAYTFEVGSSFYLYGIKNS
jgi:hypothetical protein